MAGGPKHVEVLKKWYGGGWKHAEVVEKWLIGVKNSSTWENNSLVHGGQKPIEGSKNGLVEAGNTSTWLKGGWNSLR